MTRPRYKVTVSMDGKTFGITDDVADEIVCQVKWYDEFTRVSLHDRARLLQWVAETVLGETGWSNRTCPVGEPVVFGEPLSFDAVETQ